MQSHSGYRGVGAVAATVQRQVLAVSAARPAATTTTTAVAIAMECALLASKRCSSTSPPAGRASGSPSNRGSRGWTWAGSSPTPTRSGGLPAGGAHEVESQPVGHPCGGPCSPQGPPAQAGQRPRPESGAELRRRLRCRRHRLPAPLADDMLTDIALRAATDVVLAVPGATAKDGGVREAREAIAAISGAAPTVRGIVVGNQRGVAAAGARDLVLTPAVPGYAIVPASQRAQRYFGHEQGGVEVARSYAALTARVIDAYPAVAVSGRRP